MKLMDFNLNSREESFLNIITERKTDLMSCWRRAKQRPENNVSDCFMSGVFEVNSIYVKRTLCVLILIIC